MEDGEVAVDVPRLRQAVALQSHIRETRRQSWDGRTLVERGPRRPSVRGETSLQYEQVPSFGSASPDSWPRTAMPSGIPAASSFARAVDSTPNAG